MIEQIPSPIPPNIKGVVLILLHENGSCLGLGRTLRVSCATAVPLEFLVEHIFVLRFRAHFRVVSQYIEVIFLSTQKGNRRMSRIFNFCACPCISLWENISSFCFTHVHIIFPCPCLCFWQCGMDYGSTLDLKLARFLRRACAKLARNWAEKLSLWQDCFSLLTYILICLRGDLSKRTARDS